MTQSIATTQARLLSRFLRDKGLAQLTHSQALEAIAHAMGDKSFNVHKAKANAQTGAPVNTDAERAQALLREAVALGLKAGEALNVFAESRGPEELAFLAAAKEHHTSEGDLEFDDNAVVSLSDDNGAYVMGWKWVDLSELATPHNLLDALQMRFANVQVLIEDQDVDDDFAPHELTFNDEVCEALRKGASVPPSTWVVRGLNSDERRFELTAGVFSRLAYDKDNDCFAAPGDDTVMLSFFYDA